MLFIGRRGKILTWSPFDNKQSNFKVAIVGQSGSGKSAFMQELLTGVLGREARAFVVDICRSFENTCHLLGGDFVEFKLDSEICLDPFTNIDKDDPEEVIEALLFVKGIICNMAHVANEDEMEKGIIEKAVQDAWQKKQMEATITDVAEILNSSKSSRERDLGTALYTYTNKGLRGRFFDGKSNITFKKQITVIELEEIKANASLQNVILQMLRSVITTQIYFGKRKQHFIIMFDEAWDIMVGNQGRKFIEDLARRLRKYQSSLVTGTQTLADFYQSAAA
jgi:conjugal transfer ATP-binding protein TraC